MELGSETSGSNNSRKVDNDKTRLRDTTMEVPGRRPARSCNTNTRRLCDPCESAGDSENAENYCVDCHEFLCLHCAKTHRRQTISKGHQLLERDEMPKKKMAIYSEITCRKHDGRPYDYFCKNHNILSCSVCLHLDHQQCTAEYIAGLAVRFESSGEYETLRAKMENLDELIRETKSTTDSDITESKRSADQLVSDIKTFRTEINSYLDSLENEVLQKVDAIITEDIQAMTAKAEDLDAMKAKLDALTTKLDGLSKLNRKKELVIASKLADNHVNKIGNRVGELTEPNKTRHLKFRRTDKILQMLQSTKFGKLEESESLEKRPVAGKNVDTAVKQSQSYSVKHQGNIDISHKEDKKGCEVTGSVVIDSSTLAIADWLNQCVKVIDTRQGRVLSYIRLSSYPWDITYTGQNQLVVTAPVIQTLIFLDVGTTLTVNKKLKVDGECRGIDYTDNKLIVSSRNPPSVHILNSEGLVLSSFSNDKNGKPIFSCPYYVTSSTDSSAIYVSDLTQDRVIKLEMAGRVTFKNTSKECSGVHGIAIDQYDNLYIAGRDSSTVFILSADGRQINTIQVDRPVSVALCEDTDQLFVSHERHSSSRNSISVYKLH